MIWFLQWRVWLGLVALVAVAQWLVGCGNWVSNGSA